MSKLRRDRYLDHEEVKRLLYAARTRPHVNAKRDLALFAFAAMTGARQSEILGIKIADLSLASEPGFVRILRRKKRKKSESRDDVAVPPAARRAVLEYVRSLPEGERAPDDLIFPITPQQAERLFKHYCRIAGLSPLYTFHSMRHYRGLTLYEESHDLELVREALGHSGLASTQVYVHTLDHLKKTSAVGLDFWPAEPPAS